MLAYAAIFDNFRWLGNFQAAAPGTGALQFDFENTP